MSWRIPEVLPSDSKIDACRKDGFYTTEQAREIEQRINELNEFCGVDLLNDEELRERDELLREVERYYDNVLRQIAVRKLIVIKCLMYGATREEIAAAEAHRLPGEMYRVLGMARRRHHEQLQLEHQQMDCQCPTAEV